MEFFNVQIPYRGGIPIIMRHGPIASIELSKEQIQGLMDCGVELLDPMTGKKFALPIEEAPATQEAPEVPAEEEKAPETPATPEVQKEETVETPSEEKEPESTPEAPADETKAEEAEKTTEQKPAVEFDFSKVNGYSNLSKNKKKEVRTQFAIAIGQGKTPEEAYAAINSQK